MEILRDVLVLVHLVGFAALFGGAFVQLKTQPRVVNAAMFHGALTQLVTGVALVGIAEAYAKSADLQVNHMKIGIKLLVLIAIGVLVLRGRGKEGIGNGVYWAILGLTLLDAAVAVFVPGMLSA